MKHGKQVAKSLKLMDSSKVSDSMTGLIAMFIGTIGSGCNRSADGGEDTVGWFPLFGVHSVHLKRLIKQTKHLVLIKRKACGVEDLVVVVE